MLIIQKNCPGAFCFSGHSLAFFYVMIPHGFCLFFYGIAAMFVQFIAWWAILFTGKYPKGMFDFVVGYYRWSMRVNGYMGYMTDEYPPFNGRP